MIIANNGIKYGVISFSISILLSPYVNVSSRIATIIPKPSAIKSGTEKPVVFTSITSFIVDIIIIDKTAIIRENKNEQPKNKPILVITITPIKFTKKCFTLSNPM